MLVLLQKIWTHETNENLILNGNCFQTYLPFMQRAFDKMVCNFHT